MITLLSRNEIAKTKKIIRSELSSIQKSFFDEEMLQFYQSSNEENQYREQFDFLKNDTINYTTYNKIIGLNHSIIDTFTDELTKKLSELFQSINATEFIIISHLKLDFFGNRGNKFKPLINAYEQLEKIIGNKTYNEAFNFDINNLHEFIEILFWITRCDMSVAEYIYIFDKNENIKINLCKYGNIHLSEFNKEQLTNLKLKELGWKIIEGKEFDNFTTDENIKGRQIKP